MCLKLEKLVRNKLRINVIRSMGPTLPMMHCTTCSPSVSAPKNIINTPSVHQFPSIRDINLKSTLTLILAPCCPETPAAAPRPSSPPGLLLLLTLHLPCPAMSCFYCKSILLIWPAPMDRTHPINTLQLLGRVHRGR